MTSLTELKRFGQCLAFGLPDADLLDLRLWLLSGGFKAIFRIGGETRLASVLAGQLMEKGLLPPTPTSTHYDSLLTPKQAAEEILVQHRERRHLMGLRLKEIVIALNNVGITPVLLKGARSLWTGSPVWRDLRDLDMMVDGAREAQRCDTVLRGMGYRPFPGTPDRPTHHHMQPLRREDLPGWVEIHRLAGNRYAERLLPTKKLRYLPNDTGVLILPETLQVLHALVHHHVGHSAYARGTIDLKGLYEFAWSIRSLNPAERTALQERTAEHPNLMAMIDFWLAAAADFYRLPVPHPFDVRADAAARWRRVKERVVRPSGWKYPGYAEEIGMAMNAARLVRQPGGDRPTTRLRKRLAVIAALLPPLPV